MKFSIKYFTKLIKEVTLTLMHILTITKITITNPLFLKIQNPAKFLLKYQLIKSPIKLLTMYKHQVPIIVIESTIIFIALQDIPDSI